MKYVPETSFRYDSGLIYNLRQKGWRGGKPQMENEVWISIQSFVVTEEQRDKIGETIVDALNAAFPTKSEAG